MPIAEPQIADANDDALSAERSRIITTADRHILLLAGPGAGKTHLLTHHAAWLATNRRGRVVLLTFGRKAAKEMGARARELVEGTPQIGRRIVARTIHGHALDLLRVHGHRLGIPSDLESIDDGEVEEVAAALARDRGRPPYERFAIRLGSFRRLGVPLDRVRDASDREFLEALEERFIREHVVDFGGVVCWANRLLGEHADVLASIHWHDRSVLLDEAQDCDQAQCDFVGRLVGPEGHLLVAMDPDQSLYAWRGANPVAVMEWAEKFSPERVQLTENFRCAPRIAALARAVLDEGASDAPPLEGRAILRRFDNRGDEAAFVAASILDPKREAVLARANWRLDEVRAALATRGIRTRGGAAEWNSSELEVLGVLATLTQVRSGSAGTESALPERFFGLTTETRAELAVRAIEKGVHPAELVDEPRWQNLVAVPDGTRSPREWVLTTVTALESDPRNVQDLAGLAEKCERLGDLIRRAKRGPDPESSTDRDALLVSTFHGAKGLEFGRVFIVGCEHGVVPGRRAQDPTEERRTLYVAMTRASDEVVVTAAGEPSSLLPPAGHALWTESD